MVALPLRECNLFLEVSVQKTPEVIQIQFILNINLFSIQPNYINRNNSFESELTYFCFFEFFFYFYLFGKLTNYTDLTFIDGEFLIIF